MVEGNGVIAIIFISLMLVFSAFFFIFMVFFRGRGLLPPKLPPSLEDPEHPDEEGVVIVPDPDPNPGLPHPRLGHGGRPHPRPGGG